MQEKIGKYNLIEQVGAGTSGIVYRAEDPDIGRSVAIKVMKAEFFGAGALSAQAVERFSSEIRAIGRLAHPNIVSIFDSGINEEGLPYLVMQFVDGKGLDLVLRDCGGALSPERVVKILRQLSSALDYAHTKNVVHRDIKPSNIILTEDDHVLIVDFSTALVAGDTLGADPSTASLGTTNSQQVIGTPQFMAPEVILGKPASSHADLYSLSILAFLLFTGSQPFRDGTISETLSAVLRHSAFSFAELGCSLSNRLERVLRRALSKNQEDRFDTASDFIAAIERAFDSSSPLESNHFAKDIEFNNEKGFGELSSSFRHSNSRNVKSRRPQGAFSLVRAFSLLLLVLICLLSIILGFILYGMDRDSEMSQQVRSALGFGLPYSTTEIEAMPDQQLIEIIASDMPRKIKVSAIAIASKRNTVELANTISSTLLDSRVEVRLEAIKAIGSMSSLPQETRNHCFILSLNDQDPLIRAYAAAEIATILGKKAKPAIEKQRDKEKDPIVLKILNLMLSRL